MPTFTTTFELEKSTKNTNKFRELPADCQPPRIGTMYVQKWAIPDGIRRLTVTVEHDATSA